MKEEFLKELELLLKKHNVSFVDFDNYVPDGEGDERFGGTEYYLKFGNEVDYSQTLSNMIIKIIKKSPPYL